MDQIARLVAKSEIEDCLKRYARGIDRRDWDTVRGCFHHDATDHHGEFKGTRDEFLAWVSNRHAEVPFSMHYLLNCLTEFESDKVALVETYFWAIQRRPDPTAALGQPEGTDVEVFGRYLDRFEKRDDAWRISLRRVAYDSTRQGSSSNHLRQLVGVLGRRDSSDPLFSLLPSEREKAALR